VSSNDEPELYRFATTAMASEFEILFPAHTGHDPDYFSRASTACFNELARLEEELSKYKPNSDIARINRLLPDRTARVGFATFDCLSMALAVMTETNGAFDVTVGPLMDVYRHRDGTPRQPSSTEVATAKTYTGGALFELDADNLSVTSRGAGLSIDLGGVGKGYALDQMATVLEEWSIEHALLNAGDSTVLGIGSPPADEGQGWPVRADGANPDDGELYLRDRALSGSGFLQKGAHIMDPRKGRPIRPKRLRTWAIAPTAAMSDALSTAFSVMKKKEVRALCDRHEGVEAIFWKPE